MNTKPNYKKGTTRYEIVNLLHAAFVITPLSYKLIDNPSIPNVMVKMRKEGVIERKKNNGVFSCFCLENYEKNMESDFIVPVTNYDYFKKYGKTDTRRAKYAEADGIRILRSSEITVLMYAAGIHTLPSDKEYSVSGKEIIENVYYQAREIKMYSKFQDVKNESNERTLITTRINGVLLSFGGNYSVFHIGKGLKSLSLLSEFNFRNYVENMLATCINKESCKMENAIMYTYDLNYFLMFMDKTANKLKINLRDMETIYKNTYVLPYDKNGRDMTRIMTTQYWDEIIKEQATGIKYSIANVDYVCDYYEDGKYIFVFCVPDILKYFKFVKKVAYDVSTGIRKREDFEILCFDFQKDFVIKSAGQYSTIMCCEFSDFLKDWEQIGQK